MFSLLSVSNFHLFHYLRLTLWFSIVLFFSDFSICFHFFFLLTSFYFISEMSAHSADKSYGFAIPVNTGVIRLEW